MTLTTINLAALGDTINLGTEVTGTLPTGNGGTGSTATTFVNAATNVTGALPIANGGTALTSGFVNGGGLTEADQWRVTSGFNSTTDPIANNWERVDDTGFSKIGTGMSQSSGIFTFPSTGIWKITFVISTYKNGDDRTITKRASTTVNNSSYTEVATADASVSGVQSNNTHSSGSCTIFFDVTNTSTHKIRFAFYTNNSSYYYTTSSMVLSHVVFMRMGDT